MPDHAGAHSGVAGGVDEDEAAGDAALVVGICEDGAVRLDFDDADGVEVKCGCGLRIERVDIDFVANGAYACGNGLAGVLEQIAPADLKRLRGEPDDRGFEVVGDRRRRFGCGDQVATADVALVFKRNGDGERRGGGIEFSVEGDNALNAAGVAGGQDYNGIPAANRAGGNLSGEAAKVLIGPDDSLDGQTKR